MIENINFLSDVRSLDRDLSTDFLIEEIEKYPFRGYQGVSGPEGFHFLDLHWKDKKDFVEENLLKVSSGSLCLDGLGKMGTHYVWKQKAELDFSDFGIENPELSALDQDLLSSYLSAREEIQKAVMSKTGISDKNVTDTYALMLGGVSLSAFLPLESGRMFGEDPSVQDSVLAIFLSGLNLSGYPGGGVPFSDPDGINNETLFSYYESLAEVAVETALRNCCDALVYNIGIGSGFFAGPKAEEVKLANIKALVKVKKDLQILVPNIGLSKASLEELQLAGVTVIKADKDAAAVVCSRMGLKTAVTIAADPLSLYGAHGPGLWFEDVGPASDEERFAHFSYCDLLNRGLINLVECNRDKGQVILSEFMKS